MFRGAGILYQFNIESPTDVKEDKVGIIIVTSKYQT